MYMVAVWPYFLRAGEDGTGLDSEVVSSDPITASETSGVRVRRRQNSLQCGCG
jgi:hypothetical protein